MWRYTPRARSSQAGVPCSRTKQAELFQSLEEGLEVLTEHRGHDPQVLGPDGEDLAVEVLALDLDRGEEPPEELALWPLHLREPQEVDGNLEGLALAVRALAVGAV